MKQWRGVIIGLGAALLAVPAQAEQVFKVWHHGSFDIPKAMTPVPDLSVTFTTEGPTQVFIYGHLDVKHRCLKMPGYGTDYPIGIGVRLDHVGPPTFQSRWIQGSKWGPNIASCVQHYVSIPLDGYLCITNSGVQKISLWATAHTTATNYDGVAEISPASDSDKPGGTDDPYNEMIVRVVPGHCG
jgi:hypothetical protein